jgi:hypothetical protein
MTSIVYRIDRRILLLCFFVEKKLYSNRRWAPTAPAPPGPRRPPGAAGGAPAMLLAALIRWRRGGALPRSLSASCLGQAGHL